MKVIAYYALHYGMEYLKWSIRSVLPHVDEIHIFYTQYPSFGHWTNDRCPEDEKSIAFSIADLMAENGNIFWHNYNRQYSTEGIHRDHCLAECANRGADIVLPIDADEIYTADVINHLLHEVRLGKNRVYRINMMHFWRSFSWVCYDSAYPVRALKLDGDPGDAYIDPKWKCWHFGYAQTPRIIKYKATIHGHLAEFRQGWFEDMFMKWKEGFGDVHPTSKDYWNPVMYPYLDDHNFKLLLHDHPYYKLSIDYLISDVAGVMWDNL